MLPATTANDALIDRIQRGAAASPDVLSLAGGLPARGLFPRQAIAAGAIGALGRTDCAALQYGWPEGAPELREWIAARLRARGARLTADDIIVTSGAQQAIALAVDALLTRGDRVSVDAESYPAALDLFRARELIPTTSLAANLAYVMTGVTNPRSTAIDAARLQGILDSGIPLIADEAYAELRFDGVTDRPLLAEAPERTFHVGTFSKTVCPGFRIGWLVPPRAHHDGVLRLKASADLQANSLSQTILAEMVRGWDYDAHLARARRAYARRADALLSAVRRWLPSFEVTEPEGGFSIFVQTDTRGDDARLLQLAAEHGTAFDPGRLFLAEPSDAPLSFRLCHSSIRTRSIDVAVKRLSRAWLAFQREAARGDSPHPCRAETFSQLS
jgi:2-aminoadipate transaminase